MHASTIFGFLAAAATAVLAVPHPHKEKAAVKCPLIFDGRIKSRTLPTDFDSSSTSLFNPDNVKGSSLKWSQIVKFPKEKGSRFDNCSHKPLEVTISDESVFKTQYGFRRAGLIFAADTNTGSPASKGVKTLHFSVKQDLKRPLNLTHEYLNIWHETSDWSANQFNFQTGTIIGQDTRKLPKNTFKIMSRENKLIWQTPIEKKEWQNFAITLDFNKNTLQVYYSKGNEPLRSVTKAVPNNNAGEGQYQFGILKKPTGTDDVVNKGYQESGIDEGQIYGGIFIEDSAGGCVSL
ncbi:hypothetical protein SMACR_05957 [Sordaria macrospora]|uniref:WGS project CABT00000000 data, contig 2.6 n=2 Tax=Sordaria macrospora TaxID=5147 RepID=F7VTE5_SORMK|nr:uncharacterized protein SMAC_05957 [Sordaria macrospora k-hell]KAA8633168.1 hypothetical protein SMACR_05957 [Sordaria macrospora]KAH7626683.1 hypothetical protein B0T09DRAFT_412179 [Sordaria sp. MPI-SDFR-AT-0083]WPJ57773.1 hypothetical protein SMAC4_05957 [Sordaria macrospora]CCC08601.1 unnamed protein product [Sordaria macrospora k-hell]